MVVDSMFSLVLHKTQAQHVHLPPSKWIEVGAMKDNFPSYDSLYRLHKH